MRWYQWTILGLLLGGLLGCSPPDLSPDAPESITRKVLVTNAGETLPEAIKALRSATGVGLAEAEALLQSTPSVIATGLSHADAEKIARILLEAGATTQIRRE